MEFLKIRAYLRLFGAVFGADFGILGHILGHIFGADFACGHMLRGIKCRSLVVTQEWKFFTVIDITLKSSGGFASSGSDRCAVANCYDIPK